ncbi:MAG: hypothetical protein WAK82_37800 [Streptosporangiaceae bacterium]
MAGDGDGVADSCGDGDVLWLWVVVGLPAAEAVDVGDEVLARATEPVVAGVSGRTQTYRAATARNSTTSTRVDVRGR